MLTDEALIAKLRFVQIAPRHYQVELRSGDFCERQRFELFGDEWRLDARFLKWKPLANLFGFDAMHRLTLAIEIGMQNAGLGVALALKHFEPETALPGALFAVWCILTAAGASSWLRGRPLETAGAGL